MRYRSHHCPYANNSQIKSVEKKKKEKRERCVVEAPDTPQRLGEFARSSLARRVSFVLGGIAIIIIKRKNFFFLHISWRDYACGACLFCDAAATKKGRSRRRWPRQLFGGAVVADLAAGTGGHSTRVRRARLIRRGSPAAAPENERRLSRSRVARRGGAVRLCSFCGRPRTF